MEHSVLLVTAASSSSGKNIQFVCEGMVYYKGWGTLCSLCLCIAHTSACPLPFDSALCDKSAHQGYMLAAKSWPYRWLCCGSLSFCHGSTVYQPNHEDKWAMGVGEKSLMLFAPSPASRSSPWWQQHKMHVGWKWHRSIVTSEPATARNNLIGSSHWAIIMCDCMLARQGQNWHIY